MAASASEPGSDGQDVRVSGLEPVDGLERAGARRER